MESGRQEVLQREPVRPVVSIKRWNVRIRRNVIRRFINLISRLGEVSMEHVNYSYDRSQYFLVVCRLCGSEWLYPMQYEGMFDAEHPLENCAYCKRSIK